MTTPTNTPANGPQRITVENQPLFPCWMWHRLDKSSGMWYWVPQWQPLIHGRTPEDCQYAYWAPQREDGNQPPHPEPTAPAVQPEPPITECLQGQPGDTCQHAFCQPAPPSPKPLATNLNHP